MPNTWYKVDNVAKVFLASVTRRDPRVFRISCTLTEDIDPDAPGRGAAAHGGRPAQLPGHAAPRAVLALS